MKTWLERNALVTLMASENRVPRKSVAQCNNNTECKQTFTNFNLALNTSLHVDGLFLMLCFILHVGTVFLQTLC